MSPRSGLIVGVCVSPVIWLMGGYLDMRGGVCVIDYTSDILRYSG